MWVISETIISPILTISNVTTITNNIHSTIINDSKSIYIANEEYETIYFVVRIFEFCVNLFEYPIKSKEVWTYKVKKLGNKYVVLPAGNISKCVILPYVDNWYACIQMLSK